MPKGRNILVRGQSCRRSDPRVADVRSAGLAAALIDASRAMGHALGSGAVGLSAVHAAIDAAKVVLSERGHGVWAESAPDLARGVTRNMVYTDLFSRRSIAT